MRTSTKIIITVVWVSVLIILIAPYADSKRFRTEKNPIEQKEFQIDELYISQTNVAFSDIVNLLPNKTEWNSFMTAHKNSYVYFDPRSGRPTSITVVFPLIPGTGDGNSVTNDSLSRTLGYKVTEVNIEVVRSIVLQFIEKHTKLLNISTDELGEVRIVQVADFLWQVFITRRINGVPVRDASIALSINHGNLVLWGMDKWGDVNISLAPSTSKEAALKTAFGYLGGQLPIDKIIKEPHLELVPVSSARGGFMREGYNYRLAWVFNFKREGYDNNWEFMVDAHNNQLLRLRDLNTYAIRKIVGSTYSKTNDDCCPDGCPEYEAPVSYTDTGFVAPNNFTDLSGLYNWTSGTATTTLVGRYVTITEQCGAIIETSATGDIALAGTYNQHDCTSPAGHSTGDTFSARTCASEVAQTNRIARSWANYTWLDNTAVECTTNINNTCNAWYWNSTINMYRSGGGCRNTGEEVASIDHEWGHGLDDNDTNGQFTNPEETYADLVSVIKLHASCPDRGWWWTYNAGCGNWTCPINPSSTGFKCDGYGDCCTECTGLRELDWAKHVSGQPHTPANFNCVYCNIGKGGPCGGEVHCENASSAEAGWDVAARDLQAPPFNFDRQTAFMLTTKLLVQGSGSVTTWHSCNCTTGSSDGCAATAGYMQWITADDDNGNINDGTPHMTAIYGAFNRHAIACATPTPQNSGCTTGPTQAPVVTATPSSNGATLNWTAVPNASSYYVMKGQGPFACDMEKVKIATVTGTTYTDQTVDCRETGYQVVAVGSNTNCIGQMSACVTVVPPYPAPSNVTATPSAPNQVTVNWSPVAGALGYNVYRRYTTCGNLIEEIIASNVLTTSYVDNTTKVGVTNYYAVTANGICESVKSEYVAVDPTGICSLTPCFNGATSAINNAQSSCSITIDWIPGTSSCSLYPNLKYVIYRSTDPTFIPGPSNMISSCAIGTSYLDTNVTFNTTYYYVVRAEDERTGGPGPCNGGNIDNNLVRVNSAATGPTLTLFNDGFETGAGNWTISANWQQSNTFAHTGTYSFWSNDLNSMLCDTARNTNPVAIPSGAASPRLHFWTRYAMEDGRDAGIVQGSNNGTTWTKLNLIPHYPGSTVLQAQACLGTNPQPAFSGTNTTWTEYDADLTSYAGSNFYVQFNYATDNNGLFGGWYIDDVLINYATACTTGSQPPGTVLNNLMATKSATDVNLSWMVPGGTCSITGYGIYRGTLPISTYNHASLSCAVTNTTYSTPQDSGSYYYLVVPLNAGNEGSYGTDSFGTQRPQGSSPCKVQNLTVCN